LVVRLAGNAPAEACVDTWLTDFRADLPKIDVPTLRRRPDPALRQHRRPPSPRASPSSPSKADPTTSPGPTPRSSTRRCSTSSRP